MLFFFFRNEALRVAFIHMEESGKSDGTVTKEFYSKLVKADAHGKDQVKGLKVLRSFVIFLCMKL